MTFWQTTCGIAGNHLLFVYLHLLFTYPHIYIGYRELLILGCYVAVPENPAEGELRLFEFLRSVLSMQKKKAAEGTKPESYTCVMLQDGSVKTFEAKFTCGQWIIFED